ncbi:MAG: hypothetical protein J6W06_08180 [Bacteroidales bacterium]|nr:hypothetical protein [Bacteroidales bacterium]
MMDFFRKLKITKDQGIILFLLVIIAIITLAPFFSAGIVTLDDFQYYITTRRGPSFWWEDAKFYASYAGRFYFLLVKPFYNIPYMIDNFLYTKIVQYVTLAVLYGLFSYFIYKIFKSRYFSLLVLLLLFVNTALTYMVYPVVAYPFYFSFSLILFLLSMLLFFRYAKTGLYRYLVLSVALFFITLLFYETYIVFIGMFGLYICVRNVRKFGFKGVWKEKSFYKELLPFVFIVLLYLALYFIWRKIAASDVTELYEGSVFASDFSISNYVKLLWKLTYVCFPFHLCDGFGSGTAVDYGAIGNLKYIIRNSELISYVNAILQTTLFVFIVRKIDFDSFRKRNILFAIVVAMVVALLSHSVLGLAGKYNSDWWIESNNCYVTSFFSYFGVMLALALTVVFIVKLVSKTNVVKGIVYVLLSLFIFIFSLSMNFSNRRMGTEYKQIQNYFRVMDYVVDHNGFNEIEAGSIIYFDCSKFYWRDTYQYLWVKTDMKYIWVDSNEKLRAALENNGDAAIYYMELQKAYQYEDVMMTVSKLKKGLIDPGKVDICNLEAQSSDIYYYSPAKRYSFMYETKDICKVVFNDCCFYFSQRGINGVNYIKCDDEPCSVIHLEGRFNPSKFSISNMSVGSDIELNTCLDVPTIGEMAETIRSDEAKMAELSLKAAEYGCTLDEMVVNEAENVCNREYLVKRYIRSIKYTPEWLEVVEGKAEKDGISLDEAMYNEAVWMYENIDKKKIDDALAQAKERKAQKIQDYKERILGDSIWKAHISQKAEENGLSFEQALEKDAVWMYENE